MDSSNILSLFPSETSQARSPSSASLSKFLSSNFLEQLSEVRALNGLSSTKIPNPSATFPQTIWPWPFTTMLHDSGTSFCASLFSMAVITTMTLGAGTEGGNLEASTKAELWGPLLSDLVITTCSACFIYISGPSSQSWWLSPPTLIIGQ